MKAVAAAAVSLALCGTALAGSGQNVDLLHAFAKQLQRVKTTTTVPVLLPPTLLGKYRVYASGGATRRSFDLELTGAPSCRGANACFIAAFQGQRGGQLPDKPNLRLAGGDPAIYHAFSCGGSCSPTSFWFTHGGVLYSWQAKDLPAKNTKAVLARMANQAIAAGPR